MLQFKENNEDRSIWINSSYLGPFPIKEMKEEISIPKINLREKTEPLEVIIKNISTFYYF